MKNTYEVDTFGYTPPSQAIYTYEKNNLHNSNSARNCFANQHHCIYHHLAALLVLLPCWSATVRGEVVWQVCVWGAIRARGDGCVWICKRVTDEYACAGGVYGGAGNLLVFLATVNLLSAVCWTVCVVCVCAYEWC